MEIAKGNPGHHVMVDLEGKTLNAIKAYRAVNGANLGELGEVIRNPAIAGRRAVVAGLVNESDVKRRRHHLRGMRGFIHDGDVRAGATRKEVHPRIRGRMPVVQRLRVPVRRLAVRGRRGHLVRDRSAPFSPHLVGSGSGQPARAAIGLSPEWSGCFYDRTMPYPTSDPILVNGPTG